MGLIDHAKTELQIAGLFDKDSDYEGMLAESVMERMETKVVEVGKVIC